MKANFIIQEGKEMLVSQAVWDPGLFGLDP